jgi:hypothetical protein
MQKLGVLKMPQVFLMLQAKGHDSSLDSRLKQRHLQSSKHMIRFRVMPWASIQQGHGRGAHDMDKITHVQCTAMLNAAGRAAEGPMC